MTEAISGTSHGKLNWWLKVGPVRSDGFHELETVYQELEVSEQVKMSRLSDNKCILDGFPEDIPAESNLVTQAWNLMQQAYPDKVAGFQFSIVKTLPQGGGIGGGSSNAAIALNGINQLYCLNAQLQDLRQIAANIGSDVPFFLDGGSATGLGRGEIVETLHSCPTYWLVLIIPDQRIPTAEAYKQLDKIRESALQETAQKYKMSQFLTVLNSGDPEVLATAIHNDFDIVAQNYQWYRDYVKTLKKVGVLRTFLCGSGSTIAGLVRNEDEARKIATFVGGIPTKTKTRQ